MAVDDRLSDLLVEWEQGRRSGQEPSLEELCRDTPDLLPVVRESIDSLKATDWMFGPEPSDFSSAESSIGDSHRAALHDTELPASHLTVQEFAASIFQSGLLSRPEIDELKERLDASALPGEAREIASKLVTEGKLTRYQAAVLLKASKDPLLVDNYVILDTLDTGGMGLVFKALHRSMNRVVALKLLPASMMSARDTVKRFQREVQAAAALKHPNIVAAYDADESEEIAYLVLEYVEGTNLFRLVKEHGPCSLAQAADYVRQAATGLAYLHSRGIIHRDVKPANLILANDGTVKLLDMGLVRFASSEDLSCAEMDQELTQAGIVIGTVAYMSPEQALDTRSADQRSDIYSLGCTLFFLLTGRSLYHEETGMKTLLAHREQPVPSIREFCEEAPVSLDAVFRTMVAKRPADRLQTMEEVIAAIDACVPGPAPAADRSARPMPSFPPLLTAIRRNRAWQSRRFRVGAAVTALAAAVIVSVYLAVILIRIKTNQGTTEVSVNDPNAKIEILSQSEGRTEENQAPKTGNRIEPAKRTHVTVGLRPGSSAANATGPVPVVTATARKGDFNVYLSGLSGWVTAFQTVTVRARVDGEITKVLFTEGQSVHVGDLLFEIDDRPYTRRLDQVQAQLARDVASLTEAKKELERVQKWAAAHSVAPSELNARIAAVGRSKAAVDTDHAMIEDAKVPISYCRITAPITGRIGLRLMDKGNLVRAASAANLAVITQLQPIAVIFPLPQDQVFNLQQKLSAGKELPVEAWNLDTTAKVASGKLVGIDNQGDSTTGTVRAKAVFANADSRLFPKELVNIRLFIDSLHDVVIAPTAAIQHASNETFAYVVKPDNTVERRKVVIGPTSIEESVVSSGLSPGDFVVVEGADKLEDHSKVEVQKRGAGHAAEGSQITDVILERLKTSASNPEQARAGAYSPRPAPVEQDVVARMAKESSDDRAIAQWVHAYYQGGFEIKEQGGEITQKMSLPDGDFHIVGIQLGDGPMEGGAEPIIHVPFPEAVISRLGKLADVRVLELDCRGCNDAALKTIGQIKGLERLKLRHASITDSGLRSLAGLKRLSLLDLRNTPITDTGLKELAKTNPFAEMRREAPSQPWMPSPQPQLLLDFTRTTAAGIVEFQRSIPSCLVTAAHIMNPAEGPYRYVPAPFPPAPGSGDRVWAQWLFAHVRDCRILTDVDPETWVAVAESLPPIEFHITQIEFGNEFSMQQMQPPQTREMQVQRMQAMQAMQPRGQTPREGSVPLNAEILRRLSDLQRLEGLRLYKAEDGWLLAVAGLTQLKLFWVTSDEIRDDALQAIGRLNKLTDLRISSSRLTDDGVKSLASLHELGTLQLIGARYLRGNSLKDLSGLKSLKVLSLADSAIDDAALAHVAQFSTLADLNLSGTWISSKGLSQLVRLTHLKDLDLSRCRRIDDGAIPALTKLGQLRGLNLNDTRVTAEVVPELQERLPNCRITWPPKAQPAAQMRMFGSNQRKQKQPK